MSDPAAATSAVADPATVAADPAVVVADPAAVVADPAAVAADPAAVVADPAAAASEWPADWRQKYSQDPAVQKRLERYGSPKAALDALFAAQTRISKGDLLPALKEGATPEDVADYRAAHGIPATAAEYDLTLPDGLVIGEADRPLVDGFLERALETNMHPTQVKEAVGWFMDQQEQARVAQSARDTEARMACVDTLREEFGPDYKREVKIAMGVLDNAPAEVKDRFLSGRLSDGTLIGDDPAVIRWLNGISRELNPVGTVVPGSGTNAVQAVEAEIAGLRKMMGDNKSEYWKGPMAAKNQERYRTLTAAIAKGR
jgi:hypothetical protein